MAVDGVVLARGLDHAFQRFSAGIAEEHEVRERRGAQFVGELFRIGDTVEVRRMPELAGLLGQRRDEARVGMAEHVDGNAASKIEITVAPGGDDPRAFSPLEGDINTGIGRHYMRRHGDALRFVKSTRSG